MNEKALPLDYGLLVRKLHHLAAAQRQPVNGTFELTERCNLSCRMCYVRQSAGDKLKKNKELSAGQWLDIAQQARNSGTVFLLLTGGEIFLRQDFFELFTPLTQMGFMLSLYTNGTLITDEIAKRLAEAPPGRIEITIYGATANTYQAVTGVKGGFERCCAGIERLVKYGLPLSLKTTLTRQNVGELADMQKMSHEWGVPFTASWLLSMRRDGIRSDVDDCRMSALECVTLERSDRASATDWSEAALRQGPVDAEKNFYCQAGKAAFVINPYGEMNACIDLVYPAAQTLELGFDASWQAVQDYVDAAPPPDQTCVYCDVSAFCGRCPAWSLLEAGTLSSPVPYLCEIAHARKNIYSASMDAEQP